MSYDLMVFAPEAAPRERGAFLQWFAQQAEWGEAHSYDDPAVSTPELRSWFLDIITTFPPLNGPYATDDVDDPRVTDYSVAHGVIYAAFAWSEAEPARETVVRLARQHRVGFFDVSSDDPAIVFPDDPGSASPPAGGRTDKKSRWKFW
jgi:hypothetical protein